MFENDKSMSKKQKNKKQSKQGGDELQVIFHTDTALKKKELAEKERQAKQEAALREHSPFAIPKPTEITRQEMKDEERNLKKEQHGTLTRILKLSLVAIGVWFALQLAKTLEINTLSMGFAFFAGSWIYLFIMRKQIGMRIIEATK